MLTMIGLIIGWILICLKERKQEEKKERKVKKKEERLKRKEQEREEREVYSPLQYFCVVLDVWIV